MGMSVGLLAIKATVEDVIEAFPAAWPNLEIVATKDGFADEAEIWAWKDSNERFISAAEWTKDNIGQEVYVLCRDGDWSVLMDYSFVLVSNDAALKMLSERFGSALSFMVQTTAGCAIFMNYESGEIMRSIQNLDGELTFVGDPLPQEAGIDVQYYYMDESEQLMQAFGLSELEQLLVPSTAVAIATVDHTDYSEQVQPTDVKDHTSDAKPWWKFW